MNEHRSGVITGVSVAHEHATVDEIAAAGADSQRSEVSSLVRLDGVDEAFALQTCNRAEAYVVTDDPDRGRKALRNFAPDAADGAVTLLNHEESLRHLMRVAAGLESLVIGEDQILGQVREAYEDARGAGGIGHVLEEAITKAIRVGERARTETELNEGTVSLGSAAAEFASDELDLTSATTLVVGAGEMGTLAARALDDRNVGRLLIANRTVPHAVHLASDIDTPGSAIALPALSTVLDDADLIVTTTASETPLIDRSDLEDAGRTVVIDLAQPRDVDPAADQLPTTTVHDLDDLESVTERNRERRQEAANAVETIIDREFNRLLDQYKQKRADNVIASMYEGADAMKETQLQQAVDRLEAEDEALTEAQREVVESMADSLVNKLLAPPTRSLRTAAEEDDWTTIHTATQLFDPTVEQVEPGQNEAPSGSDNGSARPEIASNDD